MNKKHYSKFKRNNTNKLFKKRRKKTIYSKRVSVPKIILFCVLILVLIFVGYSVAGPVSRFVKQSLTNNMTQSDIQIEEPIDEQPQLQEKKSISPISSKALQIEQTSLMPESIDAFINLATQQGDKTFMVELKTADGLVWYNSSLESIKSYNALSPNVIDLKSVVEKFKQNGLSLVVKLHTFADTTAPSLERDNTFRYKGEGDYKWLDNSVEDGGKPWLNPYKPKAVEYNLDIVKEVINSGVEHIIIDSVIFPKTKSYDQIDFEGLDTIDFYQARDNYLTQVSQIANQNGVCAYYAFDVSALCGVDFRTYGIDILPTSNIALAPIFDVANIPQNLIIDEGIELTDTTSLVDSVEKFLTDAEAQGYVPMASDSEVIAQLDSKGIAYINLLTQ